MRAEDDDKPDEPEEILDPDAPGRDPDHDPNPQDDLDVPLDDPEEPELPLADDASGD